MYDSGITAAAIIEMVQSEADISVTIPDQSWLNWINETEQMLYTEIIQELRIATLTDPTSPINMADITPLPGEGQAIFEDIQKIYGDGRELQKSTLISATKFNKSVWYKSGTAIGFNLSANATAASMKIIYCVRPALIYCVRPALKALVEGTPPTLPGTVIALPPEFVELMACRLRGEAYKIANEDTQSGKWLASYNAYVEDFKVWVKKHDAGFGE